MILLSFDMEEFDLPLEHHVILSIEEQMEYSKEGSRIILDLLEKYQIKATFFCTAVFAINARDLVLEMIHNGHEVASHGFYHSSFVKEDLKKSKNIIEEITGVPVNGFRMPLMKKIDLDAIAKAGYHYDSSINPTFIPGRYNNLVKSRIWHIENGIVELPASVSPIFRIPLFWLSLHNFPLRYFIFLCKRTHKYDGYLNLYLHSWEFSSHLFEKRLKIPSIVRRNSGDSLRDRLERLIQLFISKTESFETLTEFIDKCKFSNGLKQ